MAGGYHYRSGTVSLRRAVTFLVLNKDFVAMTSGRIGRACAARLSVERIIKEQRESSLVFQASRHSGRVFGLENFSRRLTKEKASRNGIPNTICAGNTLQSGSGV